MKRASDWIIAIVCILILGGAFAYRVWPRTPPIEECSPVAQHYYGRDDISVSFVKDKKINDTLDIDVTILQALTFSGWDTLCADFNIIPLPLEVELHFRKDDIDIKMAPKTDYSLVADSVKQNNDIIAISRLQMCICIFHMESIDQYFAVLQHQIRLGQIDRD